jgi:geranylgeranyl diphosphate synthase type II
LGVLLADKRSLVEDRLRFLLRPNDGCPRALTEAMRYSLLAPGKRLRPLLVILAAEASGSDRAALPAACAVEMVHTYSLIHDDLPAMDDDLRRGQPTCHKKFGETLAILAGDALLTMAFQVLTESYPPATAAACCKELARSVGAAGMVGGQTDDLAWEKRQGSLGDLESIHTRKTGALFSACLRLGVLSAQGDRPGGPDARLLESLDGYGRCFGLAFQITDDLLDVEGNEGQTGKKVQKDAGRGKLTYPGFLGVTESRQRAERLCRQAQDHLAGLGQAGALLAALARDIVTRDR